MDPQTPAPKTDWVELGMKLMSLLVIPLLGIGVSMYTEASVTRERVSQIQADAQHNKDRLQALDTQINQITVTVSDTNGQIRELRAVLEFIRSQVAAQDSSHQHQGTVQ